MGSIHWQPEADERLRKVPFFIRRFVKKRAEAEATRRGLTAVTPSLLEEIKANEHRG